jgi:hypothetical protein
VRGARRRRQARRRERDRERETLRPAFCIEPSNP